MVKVYRQEIKTSACRQYYILCRFKHLNIVSSSNSAAGVSVTVRIGVSVNVDKLLEMNLPPTSSASCRFPADSLSGFYWSPHAAVGRETSHTRPSSSHYSAQRPSSPELSSPACSCGRRDLGIEGSGLRD